MAASATFALKAGVWFRRGRRFIVSPDSRAKLARRQAEIPLIVLCRFPGPALTTPDDTILHVIQEFDNQDKHQLLIVLSTVMAIGEQIKLNPKKDRIGIAG